MSADQGRQSALRLARLRGLAFGIALAAAVSAAPAQQETILPAPHDGDLLQTCDAESPEPGSLWIRGQAFLGESSRWGDLRTMGLWVQAGLHPRLAAGLSVAHCQEIILRPGASSLTKQGLGDTRVFAKWRLLGDEEASRALSLRPALRIPTGYDRNLDSLAAFTTRTVDFELLGIAAVRTSLVDVHVNAGLSLPGGRHHNEGLAGFGARMHRLPFGLHLSGEYFLRYDIPTEGLTHEVFGAVGRPLFAGFSLEAAVHKRLLDDEDGSPRLGLRVGYGAMFNSPYGGPVRRSGPAPRVFLQPFVMAVPDPYGLGPDAHVRLTPKLLADERVDLTPDPGESRYLASVEILSLLEGTGRSITIPKLLATPQATLELSARVALRDAGFGMLVDERVIRFKLRRGTGMILVPSAGDEDTWVPPAETRRALRTAAAKRLAGEIHKALLAAVAAAEGEDK